MTGSPHSAPGPATPRDPATGFQQSRAPGPEVPPSGDRNDRFIVSADPALLKMLIAPFEADPGIELIGISGSRAAPHRLTVGMSEERAANLRQGLGEAVWIEPDHPITPA